MSNINNQSHVIHGVAEVQELSNETAAAYSGGTWEQQKPDVELYSDKYFPGNYLPTNEGIPDLSKYHFADITSSVRVNGNKTWRFYSDTNYSGEYIDVPAGGSAPNFRKLNINDDVESLRSIG